MKYLPLENLRDSISGRDEGKGKTDGENRMKSVYVALGVNFVDQREVAN